MYITINEEEAELISDALRSYSAQYREIAESGNYPQETKKEQRKVSVAAHDLYSHIAKQIKSYKAKKTNRSEMQALDPYDYDWPANDPRKW